MEYSLIFTIYGLVFNFILLINYINNSGGETIG